MVLILIFGEVLGLYGSVKHLLRSFCVLTAPPQAHCCADHELEGNRSKVLLNATLYFRYCRLPQYLLAHIPLL